jgi:hypothetical protein
MTLVMDLERKSCCFLFVDVINGVIEREERVHWYGREVLSTFTGGPE